MKKTFTIICLILAISFFTHSQNAAFGWAISGGGDNGADYPLDVITDNSRNIFTVCTFSKTASFNGITLIGSEKGSGSNYDNNLWISKISPDKTNLWHIYSNIGVVKPTAITTTPAGDLILTGTIRAINGATTANASIIDAAGTVTTFTGLYKYDSDAQAFVAKFNSNGVLQWAKEFNSGKQKLKGGVATNSVASDAAGNVYVTGSFPQMLVLPGSTDSIASTNVGSTSSKASFITKLNTATGDVVWNKTSSGGILSEVINAITFGDDGFLYAAGTFRNAATPVLVTIGNKSFTPSSGYDLMLMKLDTDGNISYIQNRTSVSETRVKDIIVKNGIICLAASIKGDNVGVTFSDGQCITTLTTFNALIAAFDTSNGSDKWHKTVLAPGISETLGLTFGIDNRLYTYGYHSNKLGTSPAADVIFGDGFTLAPLSYVSGYDAFLASYDVTNGATKEVHLVASGTDMEMGISICASGEKLYLLGEYKSAPSTFEGGSTISTSGGFDFFLANYVVTDKTSGNLSPSNSNDLYGYSDNINKQIIVKNRARKLIFLELFDVTGKCLIKESTKNERINLSTKQISSGIYILKVTSNGILSNTQRVFVK
jgi:hypothetical protein